MNTEREGSVHNKSVENKAKDGESSSSLGNKSTKLGVLLYQSASQPLPSTQLKSGGSESGDASNPAGGTPSPGTDSAGLKGCRLAAKRPRLVFGVSASGGCTKCAELRKSQSWEIAKVKKAASVERRNLQNHIAELKACNLRLEGTIKFTQGVCKSFKDECDELKKKNGKLMVKLTNIKEILIK